ncbi:MAG: hypothetical protein BV456_06625, partial [Thermoplasmata archaeon M8B2D]
LIEFEEGIAKRTKYLNKLEINQKTACLEDNILISAGEGDYIHPQITKDGDDNIVVAMTQEIDLFDSRMAWSYSTDQGDTWDGVEWTEEALDIYNDIAMIDFEYYTGLIGTHNDILEGYESFYLIPDITDLDTWEFYYWTEVAEDLEYSTISDFGYLEGQYHDMDGPVYMTTQHLLYNQYDIPDCPNSMIIGFDDAGIVGGESTFDGQGGPHGENPFATAPASDPDMSNEFMKSHYTWQFNDPEGPTKIVWKKIIPIDGDGDSTDIEYTPYQQYVGEGEHPTITHYENNVAIIFMNEGNLLCAYSNDDGDTWSQPVTIGPGGFPDVYAIGGTLYAGYVNNNNLYLITSEDNGATWSTPEQINDNPGSVVAEENCIDVHSAGIVWVDDRNDAYNIYYAPLPGTGEPPATPTATYDKQNDELTVSSTDPDGDQIRYGVSWNNDQNVDEWTTFVNSGTPATIDCGGREGTVGVIAEDSNGLQSAWTSIAPKNKPMGLQLLLMELFPQLYKLIQNLLQL